MNRKKYYTIFTLIFLIFILNSGSMLAQEEEFDVSIQVHSTAWRYFKLLKYDPLMDLIKNEIEKSFNKALNEYLKNKTKIKNLNNNQNAKCIIDAMDKLVDDIRNSKKKIEIWFLFDNGFGNQYKTKSLTVSNFPGNKDLTGGTPESNTKIYIRNAFRDFTYKRFKTKFSNDGNCEYKSLIWHYMIDGGAKINPQWKADGTPKFSIASAILHELIHIALKGSNVRYQDEATVEDIMLKIFP